MNVNNSNVERIKKVLAGDMPDRVPYFELEISKRHVSHVLGKKVDVISTGLPVNDYIEFTKMIGCDFFYYNFLWNIGRVFVVNKDRCPIEGGWKGLLVIGMVGDGKA